jgi:hypothetical protein
MSDAPEALYRWIDIVWLVVALFYVFWIATQQEPTSWCIASIFLSFCIPQFLCGKFSREHEPQKSLGSLIGSNKSLIVFCYIVAFAVIAFAILAGLGVSPMNEILGAWPVPGFVRKSLPFWNWLVPIAGIVFIPVFRVATFIEKRMWLRWVWASAVTAVALVLLYL